MTKKQIEKLLSKFDFVRWDRFCDSKDDISFYGWINRTQDKYKDFFVLTVWKDGSKPWWITSSPLPQHDKKIAKILKYPAKNMVKCQRVEYNYNIKNSIKLKCKK